MINNLDKGISSIQYNYLNLPKQIIQNSKVTNLTYRADGVKVKKLFGDIETDYLDGFQYKAMYDHEVGIVVGGGEIISLPEPNEAPELKLRIIPTAEGYYDAINDQYVYNFTDHLGNVRLSYTDTNKDGVIQPIQYHAQQCDGPFNPPFEIPNCIDFTRPGEIVEVNNYYPFGLLHNYTMTTQNAYQYKYNGKELQETGMYDYGARMYMPDIGRWGVIDPLAEKHPDLSPTMYAANNPIMMIDSDGRDWTITETYNKKTNTTHYQLTFTGAVLNSSSNKKFDTKKFASAIQSQTEAIFNKIDSNPNFTVSADIDIRSIDSKDDLKNTDTLIEIKDSTAPEFDAFKNGQKANAYTLNGKEISVNEEYAIDAINGRNTKFIPHEIGHTAGLQHPKVQTGESLLDVNNYFPGIEVPKNNFMHQGNMKVTGLTVQQIQRMNRLYRTDKLNNKKINPRLEK